jgi:hypothetical protein
MNKLSKEKRDRLVLVSIGAGAILAVLYFFVVAAQQQELRDYASKVSAAQDKLSKAEMWQRMAPNIEAQLAEQRKQLEGKHDGLAPVDKFKWFYDTIEGFIAQHKVQLVDITREPEVGPAWLLPNYPYQAATFGVKCKAFFHDFGAFLAEFENRFPYMRVQNLELEPESAARTATRDGRGGTAQMPPQTLNISLRVVTLIRPNAP